MGESCADGRRTWGACRDAGGRAQVGLVDLELAAVWQGRERGVVTDDEVYQRLDELERLLWRRVFGRLRRVAPGSRAYVGFPASPAGGPSSA
jgi:hypothetical protein